MQIDFIISEKGLVLAGITGNILIAMMFLLFTYYTLKCILYMRHCWQWLLLSRGILNVTWSSWLYCIVYWILWHPWTNNMIDISCVSATWNLIIVLFSQHDSKLNMNLRCMSYAKVPLNSDKYSLFHMVGTRRHQLPDTYLMLFPSVLTFSSGWQTGNFT